MAFGIGVQAPFFLLLLTQVSMKAMPVQPSSTLAYLAPSHLKGFAVLPLAHVGLEAAVQAGEGVVERFGVARRDGRLGHQVGGHVLGQEPVARA